MKAFVIKNEKQYETALAHIEDLMDADPGSPEEADLELWSTLIELYEKKAHPIPLPDPIEAIKFRMEQAGLARKDLVQYLGSPSKVSEVLSGKRQLSLTMMRNLHEQLGIPAAVLLCKSGAELSSDDNAIAWNRFPLREMIKRGWIVFNGSMRAAREYAEDLIREFIKPFDQELVLPMCARQHVRDDKQMDAYALCAWKVRIMHLASGQNHICGYEPGTVNQDFIREVVRLSYLEEGPRLAREYLAKNGIHLVAERHLSGTYLDGAALMMPSGHPLVALTLRYDRLDNFWFTLAHELAHVALHLEPESDKAFFDDLDAGDSSRLETEADRTASESMIPRDTWQNACLTSNSSSSEIKAFAARIKISPAIPAGRIRHETKNHGLFWNLIGKNKVRSVLENSVQ